MLVNTDPDVYLCTCYRRDGYLWLWSPHQDLSEHGQQCYTTSTVGLHGSQKARAVRHCGRHGRQRYALITLTMLERLLSQVNWCLRRLALLCYTCTVYDGYFPSWKSPWEWTSNPLATDIYITCGWVFQWWLDVFNTRPQRPPPHVSIFLHIWNSQYNRIVSATVYACVDVCSRVRECVRERDRECC